MHALSALSFALATAASVRAHGFITDIIGANGVKGQGFGVDLTTITPGNQASTTTIKDPTGCGTLTAGGDIDIPAEIEAAITNGVPTTAADGTISMNWRQVNAGQDGAGPGIAAIDVTGTGNNFVSIEFAQQFGDGGADSDNPMALLIPPGTECTGGSTKNVCLVKVVINAGPFGSCLAIATGGAAGGETSDSTPASTDTPVATSTAEESQSSSEQTATVTEATPTETTTIEVTAAPESTEAPVPTDLPTTSTKTGSVFAPSHKNGFKRSVKADHGARSWASRRNVIGRQHV